MSSIDLEAIKDISPEQIQVYTAIKNMQLKETVMWVIITGFFIVLLALIAQIFYFQTDWETKAITGCLDAILGGTMYPLVNHFFPAAAKAKASEAQGIE